MGLFSRLHLQLPSVFEHSGAVDPWVLMIASEKGELSGTPASHHEDIDMCIHPSSV